MKKMINTLIVEDVPLITSVLENALENLSNSNEELSFSVKAVRNVELALIEVEKAVHGIPLDLVLLNINIQSTNTSKVPSGEVLGFKISNLFPKSKLVVFSHYNDNYRLNKILRNLNPDGFLIKTEVDFNGLLEALDAVLFDPPFYSKKIVKFIRKQISNSVSLDDTDRDLLYHMSRGARSKDLPNFINLSKGGMERRKRHLKELLCVEEQSDEILIEEARAKGII